MEPSRCPTCHRPLPEGSDVERAAMFLARAAEQVPGNHPEYEVYQQVILLLARTLSGREN
jgi:hypothetical protein